MIIIVVYCNKNFDQCRNFINLIVMLLCVILLIMPIEDFVIKDLVGEGLFGVVYEVVRKEDG